MSVLVPESLFDKKIPYDHRARAVCAEFESLFQEVLLSSMRKTIDIQDQSHAMQIFQSLLDTEYARLMSSGSGMGIGEMLYNWLMEQNENVRDAAKSDGLSLGARCSERMSFPSDSL